MLTGFDTGKPWLVQKLKAKRSIWQDHAIAFGMGSWLSKSKPKLKPFEVDWDCAESYPCKHLVHLRDGSTGSRTRLMSAPEIGDLYLKHNMLVPDHFKQSYYDPPSPGTQV